MDLVMLLEEDLEELAPLPMVFLEGLVLLLVESLVELTTLFMEAFMVWPAFLEMRKESHNRLRKRCKILDLLMDLVMLLEEALEELAPLPMVFLEGLVLLLVESLVELTTLFMEAFMVWPA